MIAQLGKWLVPTALLALANPAAGEDRGAISIPNAEDLAVLDEQWVIASSMAGGGRSAGHLAAISSDDGAVHRLYPGAGTTARSLTPACSQPVDEKTFQPHGIALGRKDGRQQLYVVNHGARESVEFFAIQPGAVPRLEWTGCAILPQGAFANSVAVASDGTLYGTNMGKPLDGSPQTSPMGGDIISWRAERGWQTVAGSAVFGPNGMLVSPDDRRLYIASWPGRELVELTPGDSGTARRTLKLSFLPDNLRWSPAGTILATGHLTSPKTVEECYMSPRPHCTIPSAMAEVDPVALTARCTRPVTIDMATTAIQTKGETWIGTARGDHIQRIKDPVCAK
jgi:hypothetical protein